jgi:hypothetical protein
MLIPSTKQTILLFGCNVVLLFNEKKKEKKKKEREEFHFLNYFGPHSLFRRLGLLWAIANILRY